MTTLLPSRGTQIAHRARTGRQAPLSGRRGAIQVLQNKPLKVRPVDTIADARKIAGETA